ncbi:hypothetical protein EI16_10385 [Hydrogenovibrio marinus]|uniref:Uncharacterized protein n=1 Tax=Hydrogenovibrio marinus TaxID=28885 RepID=A0A066ZWK0_HYDMR|nr:hypothetical protein EI16_10385 [Hydrogenovibrio marinus]
MQRAFSSHIRDPEHIQYDITNVAGALPIEERRLKLYESLFFNNVYEIFTNQFPVLFSLLGEARWESLIREYMVKHRATTPLFHELGQEFLLFLQSEYEPQSSDPPFLFELAHYEWVEVALAVAPEIGFFNNPQFKPSLDTCYELSPVAWPLSYEWPVNQISVDFIPEVPTEVTTLLVYRDSEDKVQFITLSPSLYHLIVRLDEQEDLTFKELLMSLSESTGQSLDALMSFAEPVLDMFYAKGIIRPVS